MYDIERLSAHDKEIIAEIEKIDKEEGWIGWTCIHRLTMELEDNDAKRYWFSVCVSYNHKEEAAAGCL